ncbi:MAG: dUTPase [Christensenellaceae bacterium]|jgi:dimeric dUTPase (all-alpha-NTP-PPase superfamily)|nr:dUTPase [Christensenellaceae bacterium]
MYEDKLDTIFNLQKQFDDLVVERRNLHAISVDEWMQKGTLALMSELAELLSETNFKWWKNPKELNYENIKEELIDILHFLTSACMKVGMDSKETYQRYINKNKENFNRQYGVSDKKGYELANPDKTNTSNNQDQTYKEAD